jgi:neutral trehalase
MLPPKNIEDFYINIKSAAESGWDFSSRWFISNGTNQGKIKVCHRLADMHRTWIRQNQEKPSRLSHHVD